MSSKLKPQLILLSAALLLGTVGGLVGALFSHAITFATTLRGSYSFFLYFLPLGGLASVWLYKKLRVNGIGTSDVFSAANGNTNLPYKLTPAIFLSSVLTHLFGGSAGREGAALQLGGGLSSLISKLFHLNDTARRTLTMCGMAAVFSAVFGTPLAAAIFAVEAPKKLRSAHKTIAPILVSSLVGFAVSKICMVKSEALPLGTLPAFDLAAISKAVLLAGLSGIVCYIFCTALFFSKKLFKALSKNEYIRIFTGGAVIVLITLLIGNRDYNGAGTHIIGSVFENGTIVPYAFAFKIILTALTVGAGYKGGEIVPAFFIGATFGGAAALFLGISVPLGAAIGMAVLFAGGTKCPLSTLVLCVELFGVSGFLFYIIAIAIGFVFSGDAGLYQNPQFKIIKKNFNKKGV